MQLNSMAPSGLRHILGACDPASLVDHNLHQINLRFGTSIQPTSAADSDTISTVLQAAFDGIASALNCTFYPVATSRDPEVATQANFEIVNAHW